MKNGTRFWLKPDEFWFIINGLKLVSIEYLEQFAENSETIIKDMFQFLSDEKVVSNFT